MSLQPGSTNVLVIEHVEQAQFFSSLVAMMTLGPDTLSCLCLISRSFWRGAPNFGQPAAEPAGRRRLQCSVHILRLFAASSKGRFWTGLHACLHVW